jgi:transketolase
MKCLYVRSIKNLVVLDADLSEDCGLREFEKKFPERFIQCGIAEQNMVSIAGSMPDKLPVVNTYAAFLTSRANEQIFNNCSQHSKVIYAGHLAGLLPGRPGKSHQAVRDISLLMSIPNLTLFAPCNGVELDKFLSWAAKDKDSSYVRIEHAPARHDIKLPATYKFEMGKGFVLGAGHDVALITYGPLMLAECREAMYTLHKFRINARVINMPWLNCVDAGWLRKAVGPCKHVFVVENHSIHGGLSSVISKLMPVRTIGVIGFGQSGENLDVLIGGTNKIKPTRVSTRVFSENSRNMILHKMLRFIFEYITFT